MPKHLQNHPEPLPGKLVLRFCAIAKLTAQIPAETLSQTHRVSLCSSLLCYRKANCTNPVENAIKKPQGLLFIRDFFQMRESAY